MANPKVADRVKDTSATTGTGTLALDNSAPTGFQTFGSAFADGDTVFYAIQEQSGGGWETGIGTYDTTGPTLSRDTILASSNAGAAVNFSGTLDVFCTMPAADRRENTSHQPAHTAGTYAVPVATSATLSSTTLSTADTLFAVPLSVPKRTSYDRIGVTLSAFTSAGDMRLGIYTDSDGVPGELLLDSGVITTAGTGMNEATIAITLNPGAYWLVHSFENPLNGTVHGFNGASLVFARTQASTPIIAYSGSHTFGSALPDPFPAATEVTTGRPTVIYLRAA